MINKNMISKIYLNVTEFGKAKIREAQKSLDKVWLHKCILRDNSWNLCNKITNNNNIDFYATIIKPFKKYKLGDILELLDIEGIVIAYCFISEELTVYLDLISDNESVILTINGVDSNSIDIFKVGDNIIGDFNPDVDIEQLKKQIMIDVTKLIDDKFENQDAVDLEELKDELKIYLDNKLLGGKNELTDYLNLLNGKIELLADNINGIDNYVQKQELQEILKEFIKEIDIESTITSSSYLNVKFTNIKEVEDELKSAVNDNNKLIASTILSVSDNTSIINNLNLVSDDLTTKTSFLRSELTGVKQQISEFTFLTHEDITAEISDYMSKTGIENQIIGSEYISRQFSTINNNIASLIDKVEALEKKVADNKTPDISFEFGAGDVNQLGSLHWYCFETIPDTYLALNGGQYRIADYRDFFNKFRNSNIIHQFDEAQGIFFVSDWRGDFLRMWDNGKGVDQGRSIGSWQDDIFRSHYHKYRSLDGSVFDSVYDTYAGGNSNLYHSVEYVAGMSMNSVSIAHEGGKETRPRNIALNLIIKAKKK